MKSIINKIRILLGNKTIWRIIIALLMIVFCIYFIKNEHLELQKITLTLSNAKPIFVIVGICLTIVYILLQAWMYIESFNATNSSIPLSTAIKLFLKRNLVSVFLPAGGFSSLVFFNKELNKHELNNTQIYLSSYLYGLSGLVTVVLVAVPTLLYMVYRSSLSSGEILAFIFLVILIITMVWAAYSIIKHKWLYKILTRYNPNITILLDDIESASFKRKHFVYTLLISLLIEFVGMAHIYVAMLALGMQPTIAVSAVAYVIMVILLIASPFLRGLGAIEVSMTLVFVQFGFSAILAASVTLLFRFFEFWLPLIAGLLSFFSKKENILYRIIPAIVIFALGLINVISSLTPALPARLRMLEDILPLGLADVSNQFVLLFGIILCVVSYYLIIGSRNAWLIGLILSGFSAIGHLLKGVDYEEAIFASLSFISLIVARQYYFLKPNPRFQQRNLINIFIVFAASFLYALIGFYLLEKKHLGIEFDLKNSFETVLRMYFLFDKPEFLHTTHFGGIFINSVYVSEILGVIFALYVLFQPYTYKIPTQQELQNKANEYLANYGKSALDFFKTYFDKQIYLSESGDGFVSFKISGKYAVVLENPVAKDSDEMKKIVLEFDQFCRKSGLISIYYRIPEESIAVYKDLKKRTLLIGQEALVDTDVFTMSGKEMKSVRNAINKIEASGCFLKINEPPLKSGLVQKLQQVSDEWLKENDLEEIGFSQGVFDTTMIKTQVVLTVENADEKVLAFLNIIPDYAISEGTYDLIRMSNDAPNGVIDYLLVNLFTYFKSKGIRYVNLGLVPLAGIDKAQNITERVLKFAFENIKNFKHYRGLRDYKEKFCPIWSNKYLAYSSDFELVSLPAVLKDIGKMNL